MNYFKEDHLNESAFAFYLNKENSSKDEYVPIQRHIESCEQCLFEYHELQDMLFEVEGNKQNHSSKFTSFLKYAAAIAIIMSSYAIYQNSNSELIYGENLKYEHMIADNLRSEIILNTPEAITKLKTKAVFTFDKIKDSSLEIIIVNLNDKIVLRKKAINNQIEFSADEFDSGVYYWKIETANDILKVGKFIID